MRLSMSKAVRPVLVAFLLLGGVTGVAYPLLVTGIGAMVFPAQSGGSLVTRDGAIVGSSLLAQSFAAPGHFWSRPSATTPQPYDPTASGGSNLGATNPLLLDVVRARVEALRAADPANTAPVPIDLVTASGSGLDPEESPAAALYQVPRVAAARHLDPQSVRALVLAHVHAPGAWPFGEPRVNVLLLNLALDRLVGEKGAQ